MPKWNSYILCLSILLEFTLAILLICKWSVRVTQCGESIVYFLDFTCKLFDIFDLWGFLAQIDYFKDQNGSSRGLQSLRSGFFFRPGQAESQRKVVRLALARRSRFAHDDSR